MTYRDAEVAELRRRIARLTDEARRNEDAWKRAQRREMALLEAGDLPELVELLTAGMRRGYRLDAASVAIADPDHEIRHLLSKQGGTPDRLRDVLFVDAVGDLVPKLETRARPWLGAYAERVHGRLFAGHARLASVALLPLLRHRRVVASLHFASRDPDRFSDSLATDFLRHLASMAAFGLESAVNRAKLVQRGHTDALTGWHNRAYLETRLGEELARSRREQTSLVCLMLDVDHFKRINDDHGHTAGDVVLREVADRIASEVRSCDISARYGGEEFIVLLPQTRLETGRLLAERIRTAVSARPFGLGTLREPLAVTVSIGLAEFRPAADDADPDTEAQRIVADADRALYEAKAAGRNVVALAAA